MESQFCKCNNCGEVFYDNNPGEQPFFEIPTGRVFKNLAIQTDSGGFYFHSCPNCKTDGYLKDVVDEDEIKKED